MRIVHGPHFVRTGRKRQWHPHFGSKSLAPPTLHRQPFLPVQPIHSLVVDPPPKRSVLGPTTFLPAPPSARRGPAPAAPRCSSAVRSLPPVGAIAGSRSLPGPRTSPSSGRTWRR